MRNTVLKAITYIMAVIWIISACSLDSLSWIPTAVCMVSTAYLMLFLIANLEVNEDDDTR